MKDNKFIISYSSITRPGGPEPLLLVSPYSWQPLIPNHQRGFTLIEIAMVLVVIGILLSLGVGMIGSLSKRAKYNETKDIVRSAREAIYGYSVKNGFLPATDISLTGARALDPWGRPLEYKAATGLSGSGNACGLATTDITVTECTNEDCTTSNNKSNIAFIVYSTGEDADGACTGTTSPFKIWEQGAGYNSPCTYTATNPAHQYDDIVQYVTLDEIRYTIGCPQTLALISPAALTEGEEDSFYFYSLQAIGGKPPYTWAVWGPTNGLSLNVSGLISGTINKNTATNTGELTACTDSIAVSSSVTDSAGSAAVAYSGAIPVRPRPLNITTASLRDGQAATAYSAQFQGTGGKSTYTWSVTAGALPAGVTLGATGLLSGTPTTAGTYNFTITLSDTCTATSRALTLTVASPAVAPAPTCTLSASPSIIHAGQASTLYWAINNGPASGVFSPTSGSCSSFASSNSGNCATGAIAATTTFILPVTTASGTASCSATVTVVPSTTTLPPTCALTASPTTTNAGQTATLYWAITNGPADGTFSPTSGGCSSFTNQSSGNCITAALVSTTTFNLPVTNSNGTDSCAATVTVTGSGTTLAPTCSLTASPAIIRSGQTSTLYWAITNGPADLTFSPSSGTCTTFTSSSGGSCTTAALAASTTFNLPVTNAQGTSICAATVTVTNPAPTCTLLASPSTVSAGQTSTLYYAISNGPASGIFSPTSGACSSFPSTNSGNCLTATFAATTLFNLQVTNAEGGIGNCATTVTLPGSTGTCLTNGINIVNSTGGSRYFKRNDATTGATNCSPAWANNASLNAQSYGSGGIQPNDTYYFFSNNSCTTRVCTTNYPALGAVTYNNASTLDTNQNCQFRLTATGAACTFTDQ